MNGSVVTHEGFMNGSRTILPRVGVGVGVGVGGRGEEACISAHWRRMRPVDNADATPLAARFDAWVLRTEFGGGL